MLTKQETEKVIEILKIWPNRMGCALIPDTKGKNGWKPLEWGWKGKQPGNFHYQDLHELIKLHPDVLLCPVTQVGMMRNAEGFNDHMTAYDSIIIALVFVLQKDFRDIAKLYNRLLKTNPRLLAQYFMIYYDFYEQIALLQMEINDALHNMDIMDIEDEA